LKSCKGNRNENVQRLNKIKEILKNAILYVYYFIWNSRVTILPGLIITCYLFIFSTVYMYLALRQI